MRAGTAIEGAQCSWKPWGAVYVREGTFVLDGGEIRNGFSMRNAAVAVEHGSTFEMRAGTITGNRTSYSESIVWTKGTVRMSGGTIAGNSSNVSSDGRDPRARGRPAQLYGRHHRQQQPQQHLWRARGRPRVA